MINQRLKEAREMCGMSRRQAMRFSNVQISVVAISEIEDGLREPTEHEIKILADTYEVRPDWLRGDQDEQSSTLSMNARGLDGLCSHDVATLVRQIHAFRQS